MSDEDKQDLRRQVRGAEAWMMVLGPVSLPLAYRAVEFPDGIVIELPKDVLPPGPNVVEDTYHFKGTYFGDHFVAKQPPAHCQDVTKECCDAGDR